MAQTPNSPSGKGGGNSSSKGSGPSKGGSKPTSVKASGTKGKTKGGKNGVDAQLMPSHMHRVESGDIGIKGKFQAWPPFIKAD